MKIFLINDLKESHSQSIDLCGMSTPFLLLVTVTDTVLMDDKYHLAENHMKKFDKFQTPKRKSTSFKLLRISLTQNIGLNICTRLRLGLKYL